MELQENQSVKGSLTILKMDEFGNILDKRHIPNLVVTVGKNYIASRMVGTASNVMSHMAVGTGSATPVVGDTTLGTEVGRVALTAGTATTNVVTYTATFGAGVGTGALTEAGIFNAASVGSMLCRTTFAVVTKGASDVISISWTVTVN